MNLTLKLYKDDQVPVYDWILRYPSSHPDLSDIHVANRLDELIDKATIGHSPDAQPVDRLKVYILRPKLKYGTITMASIVQYCIAYRLNLSLKIYDEGIEDYIDRDFDFGYL